MSPPQGQGSQSRRQKKAENGSKSWGSQPWLGPFPDPWILLPDKGIIKISEQAAMFVLGLINDFLVSEQALLQRITFVSLCIPAATSPSPMTPDLRSPFLAEGRLSTLQGHTTLGRRAIPRAPEVCSS